MMNLDEVAPCVCEFCKARRENEAFRERELSIMASLRAMVHDGEGATPLAEALQEMECLYDASTSKGLKR